MSNIPKISVIIPIYNAEKYLYRCIDSVLTQTYQDFELLLIDDGSKDSSGAICDEYAAKDTRVRVFHKENGGGCPRTTDHKSEILQSVSSSDDSCLSYDNNYQLLGGNTSNPSSATYNLKVENSQN